MEEMPNIKNDDEAYKPNAFLKNCSTFLNHVASTGCPATTGDCLLHYLHSEKKKPQAMFPQTFYTHFLKALHAIELFNDCYNKDLDDNKAKILFFILFPRNAFKIMYIMVILTSIQTPWKSSKNFHCHYDANPSKKTNWLNTHCNKKGHASHCNCVTFTPCEDDNTSPMSTTTSSHCSNNCPCN